VMLELLRLDTGSAVALVWLLPGPPVKSAGYQTPV
jgi:hypothetical protein